MSENRYLLGYVILTGLFSTFYFAMLGYAKLRDYKARRKQVMAKRHQEAFVPPSAKQLFQVTWVIEPISTNSTPEPEPVSPNPVCYNNQHNVKIVTALKFIISSFLMILTFVYIILHAIYFSQLENRPFLAYLGSILTKVVPSVIMPLMMYINNVPLRNYVINYIKDLF